MTDVRSVVAPADAVNSDWTLSEKRAVIVTLLASYAWLMRSCTSERRLVVCCRSGNPTVSTALSAGVRRSIGHEYWSTGVGRDRPTGSTVRLSVALPRASAGDSTAM